MSPAKINDEQHPSRKGMNGPRPSPLKINKDSDHFIKKSTSSTSSSFKPPPVKQQQRPPVIIYTHSPKVIHTQARDFMALVQKLTGLSSSDSSAVMNHAPARPEEGAKGSRDDNESSSVLTDEHCGGGSCGDAQVASSNPFLVDIPLFTPNSSDFFFSPRPFYRYPDSAFSSPNMVNSISPSVFEFMKGLPEY